MLLEDLVPETEDERVAVKLKLHDRDVVMLNKVDREWVSEGEDDRDIVVVMLVREKDPDLVNDSV